MYVLPVISKEDAGNILGQGRSFFSINPWKKKKKAILLNRVELIYLPFFVFEVGPRGEDREPGAGITLDGVLGDNLFFFREKMTNLEYTDRVEEPVCPFVLPEDAALRTAGEKFRWLKMEYRARMKQAAEGEITGMKQIFYPFWVGYFQRGKGYDFKMLDGVSGEVQGIRMRKVFLRALRLLD